MSDNPSTPSTPREDAERIRLKRLAKLQNPSTSNSTTSLPGSAVNPAPSTSASHVPSLSSPQAPKPKAVPSTPAPKKPLAATPSSAPSTAASTTSLPLKKKAPAAKFVLSSWEHESLGRIFKVTLDKSVAENDGYATVWLKGLAEELTSETGSSTPPQISQDIMDRLLISRLEIDPQGMSDDMELMPVLASLPANQTIFEYLVGCWKRLNASRSALIKKGYPASDIEPALAILEKLRELIVSYAGLTLQEPEMFPQPSGRELGPAELVASLLSLSAFSTPLLSSANKPTNSLAPHEIDPFLRDIVKRFEPDNEIDDVLGPVVRLLLFHPSLARPEGLGGGDASWRQIVGGLEALVGVKSIALMITRLEDFNPPNANAANFETTSLLGPVCRLGVFTREWPGISQAYFSDPEKRSQADLNSSFASLRGTLKSLQASLFQIFNTLVRASPQSREAVLDYFSRIISLNVKRAGMQVDPATVSSDSFMVNIQTVLLRFAEPFMDATYSKMDRIDPLFYARSSRIDLKEETRIKATSEEATKWTEEQQIDSIPPNFVSNIFFLTVAMSHYGYLRTIGSFEDLEKHRDELKRHLEQLQGDGSWMGTPIQARMQAAIDQSKREMEKIKSAELSYEAQLLDPEFVYQSIGFTNFLSTWIIRQADPKKAHPNPTVTLPLPESVPMSFRALPEYIIEDIVDFLFFAVRTSPDKFELSGKTEVLVFALTFLTSTWYIMNPFLKSKINDVLFYGILRYRYESQGVLGPLLNSHPMALKHLISALMHFYIEVEQTGASSQFYDKFNARRNIAYILKVVWDNPTHRQALKAEATGNVDKFVRFVNLMINDVTYLMDESLSDLQQMHNIQVEMDDKESWARQSAEHRRERETSLRTLERHAGGYISLGRSTVELLKVFTAETKEPFMMPEIVDRLAAMLDYNLVALVGPKYQELKVRDPKKLRFDPRALLSDMIQVFLNLSNQPKFVEAVANDGRSYSKELFKSAADIALRRTLKTVTEVEQLRAFTEQVEIAKASIEAEEDLGEIPDEFLDPLMFTVMKDPVILPSSRTVVDRSTIKSHLLSDAKDPFNRVPLKIEDVLPDTELKAKIENFLADRRKQHLADKDIVMST